MKYIKPFRSFIFFLVRLSDPGTDLSHHISDGAWHGNHASETCALFLHAVRARCVLRTSKRGAEERKNREILLATLATRFWKRLAHLYSLLSRESERERSSMKYIWRWADLRYGFDVAWILLLRVKLRLLHRLQRAKSAWTYWKRYYKTFPIKIVFKWNVPSTRFVKQPMEKMQSYVILCPSSKKTCLKWSLWDCLWIKCARWVIQEDEKTMLLFLGTQRERFFLFDASNPCFLFFFQHHGVVH